VGPNVIRAERSEQETDSVDFYEREAAFADELFRIDPACLIAGLP